MAQRRIQEALRKKLEQLPVVAKVTPAHISFTSEFKKQAVEQYQEGYTSREIFAEAGLPEEAYTSEYARSALKRWRTIVRDKGMGALCMENRGAAKRSAQYKHMSDQEKIAYLEAENAFLVALRAQQQNKRSSR